MDVRRNFNLFIYIKCGRQIPVAFQVDHLITDIDRSTYICNTRRSLSTVDYNRIICTVAAYTSFVSSTQAIIMSPLLQKIRRTSESNGIIVFRLFLHEIIWSLNYVVVVVLYKYHTAQPHVSVSLQ